MKTYLLSQEEIKKYPSSDFGTISQFNIFQKEFITENSITFNYNNFQHYFFTSHFPCDNHFTLDKGEILEEKVGQTVSRLARNHKFTRAVAEAYTLVTGKSFSPSGLVSKDWFKEFNKTRKTINFNFKNNYLDFKNKLKLIINATETAKNLSSVKVNVFCSAEFFTNLIDHKNINQLYKTHNPSKTALEHCFRRSFEMDNVQFYEMRDQYNGAPVIPCGEAYAIPTNTEHFKVYFSPLKVSLNTPKPSLGEEMYITINTEGNYTQVESESNYVHVLYRPDLVVQLTSN